MTTVKHLKISGFKGVSSIDMELGDLNIITGRNNTGKTSFLEATNLLFNPAKIADFADNVGAVINKNSELCKIECTYEQRGQMTIESYGKDDPFTKSRTLEITVPDKPTKVEYFLQAVYDIIETGPNTEYYIDRFWGETFAPGEKDEINQIFSQSLRQSVNQLPEDYLVPKISDNCVVLKIDDNEYPYVYLGDYYTEISDGIIDQVSAIALEELRNLEATDTIATEDLTQSTLERVFSDLMVPRLGKGRFIHRRPPSVEGMKFIQKLLISQGDINLNEENAAIIVSDIEDYLKKNISSNLRDFSFDSIVFEQDEESYQIPYGFMGDGFKSFVSILWELYQRDAKNNVFLLEEPEKNMHPGYINELVYRLIQIAKNENIQLFLTTHNPDFINSFLSDNISNSFEQYMQKEFNIIQMGERTAQIIPYARAEEQLKNLNLDLRGL